jgi:hypothetical protein
MLTRGSPIGLGSTLSAIYPHNSAFIGCYQQAHSPVRLVGQVVFRTGERSARLSYLLPSDQAVSPAVVNLLEGLSEKAGERGVFSLLAELTDTSPALELFRRAGFVIYGWQRIWQLPVSDENRRLSSPIWRPARERDEILIHSLFQSLVPQLSQMADPFPATRLPGLVYYQDDDILAYVECHYGPTGILLFPFIHPEVKNVDILLQNVAGSLATTLDRPVYLAVRSYQVWLESILENIDAKPADRQALLVKRLAQAQRVTLPIRSVLADQRRAETSVPLINHIKHAPTSSGNGHSDHS